MVTIKIELGELDEQLIERIRKLQQEYGRVSGGDMAYRDDETTTEAIIKFGLMSYESQLQKSIKAEELVHDD